MARRGTRATSDRPTPSAVGTVTIGGAPVRRVPLALARHFIKICTAASAGTVAAEGLKSGQFAILAHLSRKTGEPGIDQNSIAARMGVDRARVSQLVEELEAMGLIDRSVNGADRRARVLHLTPRGEELQARLQPVVRAAQMRVLVPLAPHERELLLDLLARVIQGNRTLARSETVHKRGARQSASSMKSRSLRTNST